MKFKSALSETPIDKQRLKDMEKALRDMGADHETLQAKKKAAERDADEAVRRVLRVGDRVVVSPVPGDTILRSLFNGVVTDISQKYGQAEVLPHGAASPYTVPLRFIKKA